MSQPPYRVEEEKHPTFILDPPDGPPDYPAPPATVPPSGAPAERDRVWVHLVWELLLAVAVAGAYLAVTAADPDALTGRGLDNFLTQVAILGFAATGLAFSLRAAVPNLAVGAIAMTAGVVMARLVTDGNWGYPAAIGLAIGAGAALGLVLGLIVVGLNVPAWAASLGAAVLLTGVSVRELSDSATIPLRDGPNPASWSTVWAGIFVAISVGGAVLWLVPGIRRGLSGIRQDRDAARRPAAGGVFGGVVALVGSSALAAVAGVLSALHVGVAAPVNTNLLYVALGAAVLGGVSVFGRRAGVFGTVLGVLLLSLIELWLEVESIEVWAFLMVSGGAILVGLVVNRILEAAGRKSTEPPPEPSYASDSPYYG